MHRPARESRDGRRNDPEQDRRPHKKFPAPELPTQDGPATGGGPQREERSADDSFGNVEPVLVRLNKYLASHGVASRRRSDELIAEGKVTVDEQIVTDLGTKVDPTIQRVEVNGVILKPEQVRHRYYLLNKPSGVVCTNDEREAKPRAIDLITDRKKGRIYTVGRLDEDTIGLVLLTNDGDFAHRIMHPRYGVPKTYLVKLLGHIDDDAVQQVREGVYLAEGRTAGARVLVKQRSPKLSKLLVTLLEGKNREVRRVFARLGYKVVDLKRTRIGSIDDRGIKAGQWRPLTRSEVQGLVNWVENERESDLRERSGSKRGGNDRRRGQHPGGGSSRGRGRGRSEQRATGPWTSGRDSGGHRRGAQRHAQNQRTDGGYGAGREGGHDRRDDRRGPGLGERAGNRRNESRDRQREEHRGGSAAAASSQRFDHRRAQPRDERLEYRGEPRQGSGAGAGRGPTQRSGKYGGPRREPDDESPRQRRGSSFNGPGPRGGGGPGREQRGGKGRGAAPTRGKKHQGGERPGGDRPAGGGRRVLRPD